MTRREIIALLVLAAVTVLLVVAQDLNYYALLRNFGSQGRHIVPRLVGLPIIAAGSFAWKRNWEVAAVGLWGLVMVWAGLGALRRYTVGINGDNAMISRLVIDSNPRPSKIKDTKVKITSAPRGIGESSQPKLPTA